MTHEHLTQEPLPLGEPQEAERRLAEILLGIEQRLDQAFQNVHQREAAMIDELYGPREYMLLGIGVRLPDDERRRIYSSACENMADELGVVSMMCDGIQRAEKELMPDQLAIYQPVIDAAKSAEELIEREWTQKRTTEERVDNAVTLVRNIAYETGLTLAAWRLRDRCERLLAAESNPA